jgi:hypothetical protein
VWVHCQGRLGYVNVGSFAWFSDRLLSQVAELWRDGVFRIVSSTWDCRGRRGNDGLRF